MAFKQNILTTADGHIERLSSEEMRNALKYIDDAFDRTNPTMFIYAGDAADSRNVRAESIEYKNLTDYIIRIDKKCKEKSIDSYYIKGTPSHDGDVVKRIIEINELGIKYIEEPTLIWKQGISYLLLPEMYSPTIEGFYREIEKVLGDTKKADICVFHGMFDFAIPQLKQIDSAFNQSRSVVIDTDKFMKKYVNIVAFGGHVHSAIFKDNCYYLGRFTNEKHQRPDSDNFGFKYFKIDPVTRTYEAIGIDNPYLNNYEFFEFHVTKSTTIEDILSSTKHIDKENTVFKIFVDKNKESRQTFSLWKKIYKPTILKRKYVTEDIDDVYTEEVSKNETFHVDLDDLESMIKDMYKDLIGKELNQEIVDELFQKDVK